MQRDKTRLVLIMLFTLVVSCVCMATPTVTPTSTPTLPTTPTPNFTPSPTSIPTQTPGTPSPTPAANCVYVPYDYTSIQIAIDAAVEGDTIYVAPGTYQGEANTDLKFNGKAIHLSSFPGEATPVIDCIGTDSNYHQGFIFNSQDGSGLVISNFAVINGFYGLGGGMWFLPGSAPLVQNCLIKDCTAEWSGGGVQAFSSGVIFNRVTIENCLSIDGGGGAACFQGGHADLQPIMYRCKIINNQTIGSDFGVVQIDSGSQPIITSCEFLGNIKSALWFNSGSMYYLDINNCLFANNDIGVTIQTGIVNIESSTFNGQSNYAVTAYTDFTQVDLIRSCLWGDNDLAHNINTARNCNLPDPDRPGAKGCFHADPLFVQGASGDYYLFQHGEDKPQSPNYNTGGSPSWMVTFPGPGYPVVLENMTTSILHKPDVRFSDIGYHYTLFDDEPTPQPPPERPVIEDILGCTEDYSTNLDSSFFVSVLVSQSEDNTPIEAVELYWESFPVYLPLVDDGTCGDTVANDGRYSRLLTFYPGQLPDYEYNMYIVAIDADGDMSTRMPYVISMENPNTKTISNGPVITGRYVWFEPVAPKQNEDGFLWIIAKVEHPLGLDEIAEVRILIDGVDTGMRLTDTGSFDLNEGDGIYGVYADYSGLNIMEPAEVILDIQAVDRNGMVSRTWPVAWQTRSYFE